MAIKDIPVAQSITIKDLHLWDRNPRFSNKYFDGKEKDLINYLLSRKDFKMMGLASAIVQDFDLPQMEKLIVHKQDGRNLVVEGNRRLSVYKLLANPSLADNENLENRFRTLRDSINTSKVNIDDSFMRECLVFEDIEQAMRFVTRKHNKRNNEVGWGDTERSRYKVRTGVSQPIDLFKDEMAKIIEGLNLPDQFSKPILGTRGRITTFNRLVQSSKLWPLLGIEMIDDELRILDDSFVKKLKVIIVDVVSGKLIDNKQLSRFLLKDTIKYLNNLSEDDYRDAQKVIDNSILVEGETSGASKIRPDVTVEPPTIARMCLIPDVCKLSIKTKRINSIYHELQNLSLTNKTPATNAVAVLFRVFLEASITHYAQLNSLYTRSFKDKELKDKIQEVVAHLRSHGGYTSEQLKYLDQLTATRSNSYLSISYFHEYVHETTVSPEPADLKVKWDNLESIFKIIWNSNPD